LIFPQFWSIAGVHVNIERAIGFYYCHFGVSINYNYVRCVLGKWFMAVSLFVWRWEQSILSLYCLRGRAPSLHNNSVMARDVQSQHTHTHTHTHTRQNRAVLLVCGRSEARSLSLSHTHTHTHSLSLYIISISQLNSHTPQRSEKTLNASHTLLQHTPTFTNTHFIRWSQLWDFFSRQNATIIN